MEIDGGNNGRRTAHQMVKDEMAIAEPTPRASCCFPDSRGLDLLKASLWGSFIYHLAVPIVPKQFHSHGLRNGDTWRFLAEANLTPSPFPLPIYQLCLLGTWPLSKLSWRALLRRNEAEEKSRKSGMLCGLSPRQLADKNQCGSKLELCHQFETTLTTWFRDYNYQSQRCEKKK